MDDVFAAGAITSNNDEAKSSLVGGDIVKLLIAALLLISGILAIAGIPIVAWLKG
jgi:glutamate synthase domain-containing protein 2